MCPPGKFYYIFSVKGDIQLLEKSREKINTARKETLISKDNNVVLEFSEVNVIRNNMKGPDLLNTQRELAPLPRYPHKKYLPIVDKKK